MVPCPAQGELPRFGSMLLQKGQAPSGRENGLLGGRTVGIRAIRGRLAEAIGRRAPGFGDVDLVIGNDSRTAVVTLVVRQACFCTVLVLTEEEPSTSTMC